MINTRKKSRAKNLLVFTLVLLTLISSITPAFALEGGSSGGSGSTSGDGHRVRAGQPSTWNTAGYRIYLTNGNIVDMNTNRWSSLTPYLHDTSGYLNTRHIAIYELFTEKRESQSYVGSGRPMYNYLGGSRVAEIIDLGGNKANNTPSFSELFRGTSLQGKLPNLDTFTYSYKEKPQHKSLINWANKAFSADLGGLSSTEDINKFLDNYKEIVVGGNYSKMRNADIAARDLPTDASEFKKGNWAIVVEPVMGVSFAGSSDAPVIMVGYQDVDSFARNIIGTSKSNMGISLERFSTMGQYHTDFKSKQTERQIINNTDSNRGFAVYFGSELELEKEATMGASYNVVLQNNGKIKSKSPSGVSKSVGAVQTAYSTVDKKLYKKTTLF